MIDTIYYAMNSPHLTELEILTTSHSFYESSWDKLISTLSWIVGIFGIVVPIVFSIYQRRVLSQNELKITQDSKKYIDEVLSEKTTITNNQIDLVNYSINAKCAHVEGQLYFEARNHIRSLKQYMIASLIYTKIQDYNNAAICLNSIKEGPLINLSREDIVNLLLIDNFDIQNYCKLIREYDKLRNLETLIQNIELILRNMPIEKPKPDQ